MKKLLFSALLLSAVSMGFAQEESTDGVAQDPTVAPEQEAPATLVGQKEAMPH